MLQVSVHGGFSHLNDVALVTGLGLRPSPGTFSGRGDRHAPGPWARLDHIDEGMRRGRDDADSAAAKR
jgi:hypothetical protein